jgi:hypothetical protein
MASTPVSHHYGPTEEIHAPSPETDTVSSKKTFEVMDQIRVPLAKSTALIQYPG